MEIKYVVSPYPILLENMVLWFWENTNLAPGAYVQEVILYEKNGAGIITPGAGHQVQEVITVVGLDKVPHTGKLYTAGGTLLHNFTFQPTENIITLYQPVYFKIGDGGTNTPAVGAASYVNSALAGLTNDQLIIHRSGNLMYPGTHYDTDLAGGFSLAVVGDIFGDEEEFLIQVAPAVVANPVNDSVVGKQWGETTGAVAMYIDVTSSVNYLPIHLRKLIRISGAGAYHFDSAPPVGYPFRFINMVSGTPIIYFDVANLIQPGGDVPSITVPTGGIVEVVYDGTKFNLTQNNTDSMGDLPYAAITHSGTLSIGNIGAPPYGVGGFDSIIPVTIPDQGTTLYRVLGNVVGLSADPNVDNDVSFVITQKTATGFKIALRKYGAIFTNLTFEYAILKNN